MIPSFTASIVSLQYIIFVSFFSESNNVNLSLFFFYFTYSTILTSVNYQVQTSPRLLSASKFNTVIILSLLTFLLIRILRFRHGVAGSHRYSTADKYTSPHLDGSNVFSSATVLRVSFIYAYIQRREYDAHG